jgi:spermidine/putrescine transport system permease protein
VAVSVPPRAAGAQRSPRSLRAGPLALSAPAAAGMLVFFAAPLIVFAVYSFLTAGFFTADMPLTLSNYSEALSSDVNRTLARNSAVVGLCTAVVAVAIALPIAYWLRFGAGRWRMPVLFVIVTAMFAGYLVRIYAWRTILGADGLLNRALTDIGLIDEPLGFLIFSRFAVIVALVHIVLPYTILVLYAGFAPVSVGLLEAAQDLGANAMTRWRRVILPLMAAPALSIAVFIFILAASDYVTPQFLGGNSGQLIGVPIQVEFTSTGNWPQGAATALAMLVAFLLLYLLVMAALRITRLDRVRAAL